MRKTFLLCLLFFLSFWAGGCSRRYLSARIYLYRAGQAFYQTDNKLRRIKKLSFDERKKYYGDACKLYDKAYQSDKSVFNLDEIEHALQCCESADNREVTGRLQDFYAVYQAEHPVESEYGLAPGGGGVQES